MRDFVYPAAFHPESHGAFTVTFPDLPEAITSGRNHSDALTEAEDCLQAAIAGPHGPEGKYPGRIAPEAWRSRSSSGSLPDAEARAIPGDARKANQ
jgi:predicted RNase H-like HicB family nuclease